MDTSLKRLIIVIVTLSMLGVVAPIGSLFAQTDQRCFPETGYCISGRIRQYWEQNGGLPVFGYPIGPQQEELVEGTRLQVQWFERNRLELHPENQAPYDVLLGRLGVDRLVQQGRDWNSFSKVTGAPNTSCYFAVETGHSICGAFLSYYRSHGLSLDNQAGYSLAESIALFGLPISEPQDEINVADGKSYLTQWFERARFELHPEVGINVVLLGLLGNEIRAGGSSNPTPSPIITPSPSPTPAPSSNRIAFVSDRNEGFYELYLMNSDGSRQQRLVDMSSTVQSPTWSPDGTQLAFSAETNGNFEIYVINADGTKLRRLTDNDSDDLDPAWSPDGRSIAFTSNRNDNLDIYVMNTNGGNVRRLTTHFADDKEPTWSPDGKYIAFSSDRSGGDTRAIEYDIYIMNADGSNQKLLLSHSGSDYEPAWSPDGKRIAFTTYGYGMAGGDIAEGKIFLVDTDGRNLVQLTPDSVGARGPSWSPDGAWLSFYSARNDDAMYDIYTISATGSDMKKLTSNPGNDMQPAWAPK